MEHLRYTSALLVFLCATIAQRSSFAQCPGINYSAYQLVFEDNFDTYLCEDGAPHAFKADPAFMALWDVTNGDWGAGNEYYYPANVQMNTCGIITLIEHDIAVPFDVLKPDGTYRHITKSSGFLKSKGGFNAAELFGDNHSDRNGWGYGVFEAAMRFTADPDPLPCGDCGAAFWTGGLSPTEIDVIDVAHEGNVTHAVGDWEYYPGSSNPAIHLNSPQTGLTTGFHKFSCVWEPNYVSFYIDDCYKGTVGYDKVRTFPDFQHIMFAMLSCTGMPDGISLDIDWVKIFRRKCTNSSLDVSTITSGSFINPGFYKRLDITSSSSPSITITQNDRVTIFEAEATTIEPNFLADESLLSMSPGTSGSGPALQIKNGFFEIIPNVCGVETEAWFKPGGEIKEPPILPAIDNSTSNSSTLSSGDLSSNAGNPQMSVFPNPARDALSIFYPNNPGVINVTVRDMFGRQVLSEEFPNDQPNNRHIINIGILPSGVYIVEVASPLGTQIKKISKI